MVLYVGESEMNIMTIIVLLYTSDKKIIQMPGPIFNRESLCVPLRMHVDLFTTTEYVGKEETTSSIVNNNKTKKKKE